MTKRRQKQPNRKRPRRPRRRRIGIWLLKFAGWLAVMMVITAGLVAGISFIAYKYRVRLINEALANLTDPYHVEVEAIDFTKMGEVEITGVTLTPTFSDREIPLAFFPEVHVTYRLNEIRRSRRLDTIHVKDAAVHFDEKLFAAFRNQQRGGKRGKEPVFDLGTLSRFTESFTVENGRLLLDLPWHPPVTADWEFATKAMDFDETGLMKNPLRLALRDLRFGENSAAGHVNQFVAEARINRDLTKIEVDQLLLRNPRIAIDPKWLAPVSARTKQEEKEKKADPIPSFSLLFHFVSIDGADLSIRGFEKSESSTLLPDVEVQGSLHWQDFGLVNGKWNSEEPIQFQLDHFYVGAFDSPLVEARNLSISADSLQAATQEFRFDEIRADYLEVQVTDEKLSRIPSKDADPTEGKREPFSMEVKHLQIPSGQFLMESFHVDGKEMPVVGFEFGADLSDLSYGPEGFRSSAHQELSLAELILRAPGSDPEILPLVALKKGEVSGSWSELEESGTLEKVHLDGPAVYLTDAALGDWLELISQPKEKNPQSSNRKVYEVKDLTVAGGKLVADTEFGEKRIPKIVSGFSVDTVEKENEEDSTDYQLQLTDLRLRNHARLLEPADSKPEQPDPSLFPDGKPVPPLTQSVVEEEVFTVDQVSVDFSARELQTENRIGKVRVEGATLNVGRGLKELAGPGKADPGDEKTTKEPEPQADVQEPSDGQSAAWRVGSVEVTKSKVRFQALIPQIEGLEFSLETHLNDVPLSLEGLAAQEDIQKVEIAGIEIKDPYNSFITVAYLPTIFVEFSLAGLARQEIEKVDLIGPSLYVGQGLFWWIEYQRKFREQNEGASVGLKGEGVIGHKNPDWEIKAINANAGKIIVAPTGVPIGIVPFPFSASTSMKDGKISLSLNIPEEKHIYSFPEYKLELHGLTGDVQFNVPVEEVDNNLVQTFQLKKAIWKEYEGDNLYLAVTFDADGIYAKFGGEAYDGYVEGQFNYYLTGDAKKWDGWIAGTNFDTDPLTEILAPDSFRMVGRLNIQLVSEGKALDLGETTGNLEALGPGWFDITKLDGILENLPADWTNLQRSLMELGLIGLKRFEYDKGTGRLYLHGREGDAALRLEGDYGSRELKIHLYDSRPAEKPKDEANLTSQP